MVSEKMQRAKAELEFAKSRASFFSPPSTPETREKQRQILESGLQTGRGGAISTQISQEEIKLRTEGARQRLSAIESRQAEEQPQTITRQLSNVELFEQERAKPSRDVSFSDIAFRETFGGKQIPEEKIGFREFIDVKFERGLEKAQDILFDITPKGRFKEALFTPVKFKPISGSEILAFGGFGRFLATTGEFAGAISRQIKPTFDTTFISRVTPRGATTKPLKGVQKGSQQFDVEIFGKTTAEEFGKPIFTSTRQQVFGTGEQTLLGSGRGIRISQASGTRGQTLIESTTFDIGGGIRQLGKAQRVQPLGEAFGVRGEKVLDTGTGAFAKSFAQDTKRFFEKPDVLGFGIQKQILPTTRITQTQRGLKGFGVEQIGISEQKVFGTITPFRDTGISAFRGQTERPILSISPRGISQRLENINVRGLIIESEKAQGRIIGASAKDILGTTRTGTRGLSFIQEGRLSFQQLFKQPLKQTTRQLPKGVEQSIIQQIGGSSASVRSLIQQQTQGSAFLTSARITTTLGSGLIPQLETPRLGTKSQLGQLGGISRTQLQSFDFKTQFGGGVSEFERLITGQGQQDLQIGGGLQLDKQVSFQPTRTRQLPITKLLPTGGQETIIKSLIDTKAIQSTFQPQLPKLDTKQEQKQLLKTEQKQLFRNLFEQPRGGLTGLEPIKPLRGGFFLPPAFFQLGGFGDSRTKTKGRRVKGRIAPSLTGTFLAGLGEFGELPKELFTGLGLLPTQIRKISKKKKKK